AQGTLRLNKLPGYNAIAGGALVVGDQAGGADADVLQIASPEQILNTVGVTMNTTGKMETLASAANTNSYEVQYVTVTGGAGTFTLNFNGSGPSTTLASNDSLINVQNALNALSTINSVGSVVVYGAPGAYVVEFQGGFAGTNVAQQINVTPAGGPTTAF